MEYNATIKDNEMGFMSWQRIVSMMQPKKKKRKVPQTIKDTIFVPPWGHCYTQKTLITLAAFLARCGLGGGGRTRWLGWDPRTGGKSLTADPLISCYFWTM